MGLRIYTVDQIIFGQGSRKVNKCTLQNEQPRCKRLVQKRFLNNLPFQFEISKLLLTCDAPAIFFVGKSPPFL